MFKYTIYTEDVNPETIERLVSATFDGYTMIRTVGVWHGVREQSLMIEVLTDTDRLDDVKHVAHGIKVANAQEAVLVTSETVPAMFV